MIRICFHRIPDQTLSVDKESFEILLGSLQDWTSSSMLCCGADQFCAFQELTRRGKDGSALVKKPVAPTVAATFGKIKFKDTWCLSDALAQMQD